MLCFSESISPLSETDDVVFLNISQYTMHEVLRRHSYNLYQVLWNLQILLLNMNTSFWCIKNDLQLKISLRVYNTHRKINDISLKMFFFCK